MANPTRAWMQAPTRDRTALEGVALRTLELARKRIPQSSGAARDDLDPYWGDSNSQGVPFIGLEWSLPHVWYQEMGISPFTMHALEGKTVPMWINDPDGTEREKNPKAEIRVREDGVTQVLIFRRAARQRERKEVIRRVGGLPQTVNVPRSYPGAPGRIVKRAGQSFANDPRQPGQITRGNVGVRWRHPGLAARGFIFTSIQQATREVGWVPRPINTE